MSAALAERFDDELDLGSDDAAALDVEAIAEVFAHYPSFAGLLEIRPTNDAESDVGGLVPFDYDSWRLEQQRFERDRTGHDIVLKPRQVGFSTLELGRDLQFAVTRRGVNVVVVVHRRDAADDLFRCVKVMLESLRKLGLAPRTKYDSVRQIVFADLQSSIRIIEAGTTEQAAAGKGRSGTIHRLHITELAFWGAAQTTMTALLACVPSNGEVVIESTANGASGTFYKLVQAAKEGRGPYKLHFFPWYLQARYRLANDGEAFDARPRDDWEKRLRAAGCDDEQIRWWRNVVDNPAIGLEKALQEYPVDPESCFRTGGGNYISAPALDALAAHVREPKRIETSLRFEREDGRSPTILDIEIRTFVDPVRGRRYVVAGDASEGVGGDASAVVVLDWETGEMVATGWSDTIAAGDFGLALAVIGRRYGNAVVAVERNNHGHAVLRALQVEAEYPDAKVYRAADRKPGWLTSPSTRPVLFDDLRMAIESGVVWTPDVAVLDETRTIVRDPSDGKPRGRNKGQADGARDDRFVTWGIAWQVRSRPLPGQRTWDAMARLRTARTSGTGNGSTHGHGHANGDAT